MSEEFVTSAQAYFDLANLARRTGRYEDALRLLLLAEARFRERPEGTQLFTRIGLNLGLIYCSIGLPYHAITRLNGVCCDQQTAHNCNAGCAEVFHLLGVCYQRISDYLNAERCLTKARSILNGGDSILASVLADLLSLKAECLWVAQNCMSNADDRYQLDQDLHLLQSEIELLIPKTVNADPACYTNMLLGLARSAFYLYNYGYLVVHDQKCAQFRDNMLLYTSEALNVLHAHFGHEHPILFDWLLLLAEDQIRQRNYDLAQTNLEQAKAIGEKTLGKSSGRLIECIAALLRLPRFFADPYLLQECARLSKMEIDTEQQSSARHVMVTIAWYQRLTFRYWQSSPESEKLIQASLFLLEPFLDLQNGDAVVRPPEQNRKVSKRTWSSNDSWKHKDYLDYATILEVLGRSLKLRNKHSEQEAALRNLIAVRIRLFTEQNDLNRMFIDLADCLVTQRKFAEADIEYARVSSFDPHTIVSNDDPARYIGYANYLRKTGSFLLAQDIEKTLKDRPWHNAGKYF